MDQERRCCKLQREDISVGEIYLADACPDVRTVKNVLVEVVALYQHHILCRTVVVPGEYGMSLPYNMSFFPSELKQKMESIKEIKKWIWKNNPNTKCCFGELNANRQENLEIQEKEFKRLADLLGEYYE